MRKYDSAGNLVFTRQTGTDYHDEAFGIGVDSSGNIYVGGITSGAFPGHQAQPGGTYAFVQKYDASGNVSWTRQFGAGASAWSRRTRAA